MSDPAGAPRAHRRSSPSRSIVRSPTRSSPASSRASAAGRSTLPEGASCCPTTAPSGRSPRHSSAPAGRAWCCRGWCRSAIPSSKNGSAVRSTPLMRPNQSRRRSIRWRGCWHWPSWSRATGRARPRRCVSPPISRGLSMQCRSKMSRRAKLADAAADAPDLASHWQLSLDRLQAILDRWPERLAESGRIDLADRRNRLLRALAERWGRSRRKDSPWPRA